MVEVYTLEETHLKVQSTSVISQVTTPDTKVVQLTVTHLQCSCPIQNSMPIMLSSVPHYVGKSMLKEVMVKITLS